MDKIYFIVGSQDLYGDECLRQVREDSEEMTAFFNENLGSSAKFELLDTVVTSQTCLDDMTKAQTDPDCAGVIIWAHTFSPAKMWIKGLKEIRKPILHLCTQAGERLPYDSIDMDFMNLNQSAHGDRELGYILTRMNIKAMTVAGYYKNEKILNKIDKFISVAKAIKASENTTVATFGNNMRDVAVTDGNRLSCEIKYGWEIKYWGIGEIAEESGRVKENEVAEKMKEYSEKYTMATDNIESVKAQARYEIALEKFLSENNCSCFTDNFQDLHGLSYLPGLSAQNLMKKGVGFGPEGDYKIAAYSHVLMEMSRGRKGATGFIEDYTYDMPSSGELELASHMLEVPPQFAAGKPEIKVYPLSIGGKDDPARLVFDSVEGRGIQTTIIDLGDKFRIICADVELVKQPEPMPKLPVARVMFRHFPDFETGIEKWIMAGGAHHSVLSTALTKEDIELFAYFTDTEIVTIG